MSYKITVYKNGQPYSISPQPTDAFGDINISDIIEI